MLTMLPKEIMRVHMHDEFEQSHKVEFDVFLMRKPSCGIGAHRIIQILRKMQESSHAMIQNKHGRPMTIQITPKLVALALKVSNHGKDFTKWLHKDEKEFVFCQA